MSVFNVCVCVLSIKSLFVFLKGGRNKKLKTAVGGPRRRGAEEDDEDIDEDGDEDDGDEDGEDAEEEVRITFREKADEHGRTSRWAKAPPADVHLQLPFKTHGLITSGLTQVAKNMLVNRPGRLSVYVFEPERSN